MTIYDSDPVLNKAFGLASWKLNVEGMKKFHECVKMAESRGKIWYWMVKSSLNSTQEKIQNITLVNMRLMDFLVIVHGLHQKNFADIRFSSGK